MSVCCRTLVLIVNQIYFVNSFAHIGIATYPNYIIHTVIEFTIEDLIYFVSFFIKRRLYQFMMIIKFKLFLLNMRMRNLTCQKVV